MVSHRGFGRFLRIRFFDHQYCFRAVGGAGNRFADAGGIKFQNHRVVAALGPHLADSGFGVISRLAGGNVFRRRFQPIASYGQRWDSLAPMRSNRGSRDHERQSIESRALDIGKLSACDRCPTDAES